MNSIGLLTKSAKSSTFILGNKCLFSALKKQSYKVTNLSLPWMPICSSTHQSILKSVQPNLSKSMSTDHSHSKLWTAERFLSAGLLGLVPLALVTPSPVFDYALAIALTAHVHWGVEAIVVDYARPSVVGATVAKLTHAGVYALTVFTLGGLLYFNYTDVGLGQAIRMLWKL